MPYMASTVERPGVTAAVDPAAAAACFSNIEAFCNTEARERSSFSTIVGDSVSFAVAVESMAFVQVCSDVSVGVVWDSMHIALLLALLVSCCCVFVSCMGTMVG